MLEGPICVGLDRVTGTLPLNADAVLAINNAKSRSKDDTQKFVDLIVEKKIAG